MPDKVRAVLSAAVIRILRPLVRIVLRCGVSYQAFNELVKWVFVDVAQQHFGIEGRKQTKSRIAVITGLTRREVDRLVRAKAPGENEISARHNRAGRVLTGWAETPEFQDQDGKPALLALEGDGLSFAELVRCFSGNAPARAVLDELVRVGAVERCNDGEHVRLLKSHYIPITGDEEVEKLNIMGLAMGDLASTISHNVREPRENAHFQRLVYEQIPADATDLLQSELRTRGQNFADQVDGMLARKRKELGAPDDDKTKRIGLGIYYIEEDWDA